jgi:hypothetical protein
MQPTSCLLAMLFDRSVLLKDMCTIYLRTSWFQFIAMVICVGHNVCLLAAITWCCTHLILKHARQPAQELPIEHVP